MDGIILGLASDVVGWALVDEGRQGEGAARHDHTNIYYGGWRVGSSFSSLLHTTHRAGKTARRHDDEH